MLHKNLTAVAVSMVVASRQPAIADAGTPSKRNLALQKQQHYSTVDRAASLSS